MRIKRCLAWAATAALSAVLLAGCATNQNAASAGDQTADQDHDVQRRAGIRLQLAVSYYQQRQWQTALDEARQAIQIDPTMADAYTMAALTYMELGDARQAEEYFLRAMKLSPNDPDLSNNYGWFLCQNGRAQQSIPYFEAAVKNKAYQSPAKALSNAGSCSLLLKNTAEAERYFNEAFHRDPTDVKANVNLARMNLARGDLKNAQFYTNRLVNANVLTAEVLWLAIRVEHKLGNRSTENSLGTQLRRRYPDSPEFASYQRGVFNE